MKKFVQRILSCPEDPGKRAFVVAWLFFVVAAAIGLILRLQQVVPSTMINYGFLLHAHSHVAFLGWVFNAFFALAFRFFILDEDRTWFWRVFMTMQVAVVGMLVTYPVQGYARESIIFSTIHMGASAAFAWKLWRHSRAISPARGYLRAALGCLIASAAGPLLLGPLAAAGLRDSPWYAMAIYYYLHFQYNGWFILFLFAVFFQNVAGGEDARFVSTGRAALAWLATGVVLTLAISALWMAATVPVRIAGGAGGAAQLIGCWLVGSLLWRRRARLFQSVDGRFAGILAVIAAVAFFTKAVLQLMAAFPAFDHLSNHRFMVIGFLHLVFLGVVTPLLIAWAVEMNWIRLRAAARTGIVLLLAGAVASELVLVLSPLGICQAVSSRANLLTVIASSMMVIGAFCVALFLWSSPQRARSAGDSKPAK